MGTGVDACELSKLANKFPEIDIEWRIGMAGIKSDGEIWAKCLAYITNRAIMQRLDDVCGPENWKNEFIEWHGTSQLCGISIKVDGEWITKWDGADQTHTEATKGGLSDSMKRAGYQWGIGRYLYSLKEGWAKVHENGMMRGQYKDKGAKKVCYFRYDPPPLPKCALPDCEAPIKREHKTEQKRSRTGMTSYQRRVDDLLGIAFDSLNDIESFLEGKDVAKMSDDECVDIGKKLNAIIDLKNNR